jgi:transketolase
VRNTFVKQLEIFAEKDGRVMLLVGDIGFGVFENFQKKFPNQFINMGIAEQNMISVASGLAKEGFKPVVYTIIPFLTMRGFEQIRVDICMHSRNVLLVGVGGGFSYDILGPTHHALEDIAIMRSLPDMKIYTPGTPSQITTTFTEIINENGPKYLRLGKNGEKELQSKSTYIKEFGAFKSQGNSLNIIISHGPISFEVEKARLEIFNQCRVELAHYSVIKNEPLSEEFFDEVLSKALNIFIIEECYSSGSLYSEITQRSNIARIKNIQIVGLHPKKKFYTRVAQRSEILSDLGLDSNGIYQFLKDNTRQV